jgi:hypothetical protein
MSGLSAAAFCRERGLAYAARQQVRAITDWVALLALIVDAAWIAVLVGIGMALWRRREV